VYLCKQNKPANFDSGGCSETWLRALIAEALPSITVQRYEKELKQTKTYQTTKREFTKQPNKNLPNNQIVIKFFVCFIEKLYFCTKIFLYGRAF
jgi:hypothetical protein